MSESLNRGSLLIFWSNESTISTHKCYYSEVIPILRRASQLSTHIFERGKQNEKDSLTTISLWSPIGSGAKISVVYTPFRICNHIDTLFGLLMKQSKFSQKSPTQFSFGLRPFWNLNFDNSKVNLIQNFWYFQKMLLQDVSFLSLENQIIICSWTNFYSIFGPEDKRLIWVSI